MNHTKTSRRILLWISALMVIGAGLIAQSTDTLAGTPPGPCNSTAINVSGMIPGRTTLTVTVNYDTGSAAFSQNSNFTANGTLGQSFPATHTVTSITIGGVNVPADGNLHTITVPGPPKRCFNVTVGAGYPCPTAIDIVEIGCSSSPSLGDDGNMH